MAKKIIVLMILTFFTITYSVHASNHKVEIFHIEKGKVVKEVPMNKTLQEDMESILIGVTDVFRGFEPIPKKGYMVRIPLEPAVHVKNEWFEDLVSEAILIFPEYENPHIMVFTNENNPSFFSFNASVDGILKELNLKFKGQRE